MRVLTGLADRFMESEVELAEEINKLQPIAAVPELYPELIRLNAIPSVIGLLAHENTDISIAVVNLLHELCDDDVLNELEDVDEFVDVLVANNTLELMVQNLSALPTASFSDLIRRCTTFLSVPPSLLHAPTHARTRTQAHVHAHTKTNNHRNLHARASFSS